MKNIKLIILFCPFIALAPGCSLRRNNAYTAVLSDEVAAQALDYALAKQGCPYVSGGQGPDEFDCSGLVIWAYMEAYPLQGIKREQWFAGAGRMKTVLWENH